jgi:hypothetical protein
MDKRRGDAESLGSLSLSDRRRKRNEGETAQDPWDMIDLI